MKRPNRRYRIQGVLLSLVATLVAFLVGCGGGVRSATNKLPENIMVQPQGTVGIISVESRSQLPTALRALGIPYRRLAPASLAKIDLKEFAAIVIDEEALDDDGVLGAYRTLLAHVRSGGTMLVLRQEPKPLTKATLRFRSITAQDVDFGMNLVAIRKSDPMITTPNKITREDLDSLSRNARQIARGGSDARGIISGNLTAPDSSAILLWDPVDQGVIWYLSIAVTARAAAGFEAEQKLLANLLSNR